MNPTIPRPVSPASSTRVQPAADRRVHDGNRCLAERPRISPDGTQWCAEDRPCPICASTSVQILGRRGGIAHRHGKGVETNVVRCRECRVLYTKPTLIPASNPYAIEPPDTYFQHHNFEQKILLGQKLAAFAEGLLGNAGRMLELGCGRGELLIGAARRGWTVRGVEMTPAYADIAEAHGVEVERTAIERCTSLTQTYDVVLLSAILEHLYAPLETLQRVRKALRPGGLVYIDVPNESSLAAQVGKAYVKARRRNWAVNLSPTFAPFHVVGFSPASLRRTLARAGFRVYALNAQRWPNAYTKPVGAVQHIERWALGVVQVVGASLGMGDGLLCWAMRD